MTNRQLSESPPEVNPQTPAGWIAQERRYQLITPLVGGGVRKTHPDPVALVRGSAVRGQLRFWWRACRGAYQGTLATPTPADRLADMRAREAALWGMAALTDGPLASKVNLRVLVTDKGEEVAWDAAAYAGAKYALFPLDPRDKADDPPSGVVRAGVKFTLWLEYPAADKADVEAALWAWETFGGLGARTRRGCGALQCTQIDRQTVQPPADAVACENGIDAALKAHVLDGAWPQAVPHLRREPAQNVFMVTHAKGSATAAWSHLVGSLQKYRQQRQAYPYGRSQWPEPDTIRQRELARYGGVLPATRLRLTTVEKFPRGQFGLPIVFHLYKEPGVDDYNVTLQGAKKPFERMASPLVLRPLALAGGDACGVALVLAGRALPPGGVVLKGTADTTESVAWDATEVATVQTDTAASGARLKAQPDPVRDFVEKWLDK